jgi:dTDP-4-amino-4,6-dideoxygalactose transaminase
VRVPQVDLVGQFHQLRDEVMRAIEESLASGNLFLGPNTRTFEDEFAEYCGARACIAVANGTDALHLALRACGVGEGDEVITVSQTFIATIEAIHQVGARAVLVDIDPRTFTIDIDQIESHVTPRTRAIIPVHLYGRLVDVDGVLDIAKRRNLMVIEDASQAHGAVDKRGRKAGSIGDLATFSFYYAKNLGAYGEAGAITTSNDEMARSIRSLRSHGESVRYEHEVLGYNSRPDEIQCAVLRVKLRHLEDWNARRRRHAAAYHQLLENVEVVGRPELLHDGSHVYHQYVVRVPLRDSVRDALARDGIGTGVHYPIPVHLQPACRGMGYAEGDLPHTERAAREVLSLPMFPELSDDQIEYVAARLDAACAVGA